MQSRSSDSSLGKTLTICGPLHQRLAKAAASHQGNGTVTSGQGGAIFGARSQNGGLPGGRFRAESIRMAIAELLTIESGRPIHRLSQAQAPHPAPADRRSHGAELKEDVRSEA